MSLPKTRQEWQRALRDRGHYQGEIDGILGIKSAEAAEDYIESLTDENIKEVLIDRIGGVNVYRANDGIRFTSGLTVDADGSPRAYHPISEKGLDHLANAGKPGNWWGIATDESGNPYIQGPDDPAPGYYVSTTSLQNSQYPKRDPRRYIDSEAIPYVVIPLGCKWAKLRDLVHVTYRGTTVKAIVADLGPKNHLGEGSIALAKALGIYPNPKTGGAPGGVLYYFPRK